jgi:uncharacterized protein (DUF3084 family)
VAAVSTLVVGIFWLLDRRLLSGWLQANKLERERRLEFVQTKEQDEKTLYLSAVEEELKKVNQEKMNALNMIGSRLNESKSYIYVSFYGFWLLVAWVIFFTFALMPIYQNYM